MLSKAKSLLQAVEQVLFTEAYYDSILASAAKVLGMSADKIEDLAVDADPTKRTYIGWIIKQMKFKNIRLPEDTDRVMSVLAAFEHYKTIGSVNIQRDINQYRMFQDLEDVIDKLTGQGVVSKAAAQRDIMATGATEYRRSRNWVIYKVTTPEAAVAMARNTKWCLSNPRTAASYLAEGPLYVIFKVGAGNKMIKHAAMTDDYSQLMDVRDRPLSEIPDELKILLRP